MTRRSWETEDGWTVVAGWDRPLQHFFMDISRDCKVCDGGGYNLDSVVRDIAVGCETCRGEGVEYLFNNLTDKKYLGVMGGMKIEEVSEEIKKRVNVMPPYFILDLADDCRDNVGNLEKSYGVGGKVIV